MTLETLLLFKPMGKRLDPKTTEILLGKHWDNRIGKAYVHLLCLQDKKKFWFVFNEVDHEFSRKPDWGIPTESVRDREKIFNDTKNERDFGTAQRCMRDELNVFNGFRIDEYPVYSSYQHSLNKYHFVFVCHLDADYPDVYVDVPENIKDSAQEVTRAKLVDIFDNVEESKDSNSKFVLTIEKMPVRIGHFGFLQFHPDFCKFISK